MAFEHIIRLEESIGTHTVCLWAMRNWYSVRMNYWSFVTNALRGGGNSKTSPRPTSTPRSFYMPQPEVFRQKLSYFAQSAKLTYSWVIGFWAPGYRGRNSSLSHNAWVWGMTMCLRKRSLNSWLYPEDLQAKWRRCVLGGFVWLKSGLFSPGKRHFQNIFLMNPNRFWGLLHRYRLI